MKPAIPETIEILRGERTLVYRRDARLTCPERGPAATPGAAESSLPDLRQVAVPRAAAGAGRPVYRLEDGPVPFVPTGRLFVRLSPGRRLDAWAPELAALGLCVAKINDWAPHSGWVEAEDGDLATSLGRIDAVRRRLAAESVEPEMLTAKR